MKKLDQCIRLTMAIDEGGRIELSWDASRGRFELRACDSNEGELAASYGDTLDEAVSKLRLVLGERAARLREALVAFDSE